jgi:hypothetical protein
MKQPATQLPPLHTLPLLQPAAPSASVHVDALTCGWQVWQGFEGSAVPAPTIIPSITHGACGTLLSPDPVAPPSVKVGSPMPRIPLQLVSASATIASALLTTTP